MFSNGFIFWTFFFFTYQAVLVVSQGNRQLQLNLQKSGSDPAVPLDLSVMVTWLCQLLLLRVRCLDPVRPVVTVMRGMMFQRRNVTAQNLRRDRVDHSVRSRVRLTIDRQDAMFYTSEEEAVCGG